MSTPKIVLVAAMATNRGIGRKNTLPWRLPGDMRLFRQNTLNKTVLMGRNTAFSIGSALPKRKNLVLTSGAAPFPGQTAVVDLKEALAHTEGEELMVIGGEQTYRLALPYASKICLTVVQLDVPDADTFFPEFDELQWNTTHFARCHAEGGAPAFIYTEFQRSSGLQVP